MKYSDFEKIVSQKRMNRYVQACGGNTRKAMTLYRYNIELSQVMFAIICHFEVALRNAIDNHLMATLGNDWIRNSVMPNGVFTHPVNDAFPVDGNRWRKTSVWLRPRTAAMYKD